MRVRDVFDHQSLTINQRETAYRKETQKQVDSLPFFAVQLQGADLLTLGPISFLPTELLDEAINALRAGSVVKRPMFQGDTYRFVLFRSVKHQVRG